MPLLLLPRLENSFVPFEFVEQDREVPLLQVACFIACVQDLGLRIKVHSADWEEHRLSIFIFLDEIRLRGLVIIVTIVVIWIASPDLLQLVVEPLTQQYIVVLEGTWYDRVEIKVTIHISRHKTIMSL